MHLKGFFRDLLESGREKKTNFDKKNTHIAHLYKKLQYRGKPAIEIQSILDVKTPKIEDHPYFNVPSKNFTSLMFKIISKCLNE